jgi:hypothetical protein
MNKTLARRIIRPAPVGTNTRRIDRVRFLPGGDVIYVDDLVTITRYRAKSNGQKRKTADKWSVRVTEHAPDFFVTEDGCRFPQPKDGERRVWTPFADAYAEW